MKDAGIFNKNLIYRVLQKICHELNTWHRFRVFPSQNQNIIIMKFNKILIPTELDDLSLTATKFALKLAEQLKIREVILLNIIIPAQSQAMAASGGAANAPVALTGQFNTTIEEKHRNMAEKIADEHSTDSVRLIPEVRFSGNKSNLNAYMEEFDAGLIVAGSRDHHTFLEKLFGSQTHRMIHRTDYPMIILKNDGSETYVKEIALAIDVKEKEQKGINDIIEFAEKINAKLQLVHVIAEDEDMTPEEAIEKLRVLAEEKNLSNHAINVINNNNLEEGLRHFIRKYNPGMLAVLTEGKGKLKKLIYGSSAEEIMKETDKPVLVNKMS